MKLYYSTGACSLSPHIILREAGIPFLLERVDMKTKKTQSGEDFTLISKKGYVPHLVLDNGEHLTEGVAMVQFLADQYPQSELAPKNGTMERVRLQEWLNYISTEVHKSHFPLFHPETGAAAAEIYTVKIKKTYDYLSAALKDQNFLLGENFSVADAYLFTVLNWAGFVKMDLSPWPVLTSYMNKILQRPKVQEALKAEGLI